MNNQILLVFALVFAVIGTFGGWYMNPPAGPWYGRFNFLSAAFACYIAALLFGVHRGW